MRNNQRAMQIDFAPRSVRRSWFHLHPAVLALGGAGLLLCIAAGGSSWRLLEQQREREHQLRHVRERAAALSTRPAAVAKVAIPEAQAAFVNGAVMQLNLPWRELQDAVLAATPRGVALVAMEPDPRKRILKITAETRNSDDMVAYIEALKEQDSFSGVMLSRHEINEQDPNRPLRFQLEATWLAK
jgi:Tfp pilus assembly protein PilN